MKFWVKCQEVDQGARFERMVNVCDEKLLGKVLIGSTKVSEYFYKGELLNGEEMLECVENGTLINFMGKKCVELAIEAGVVNSKNVLEIAGQKHAIVILE